MHARPGPLQGGGQRERLLARPYWSLITTGRVPHRRLPQRAPRNWRHSKVSTRAERVNFTATVS
jgi:hypothetical protein